MTKDRQKMKKATISSHNHHHKIDGKFSRQRCLDPDCPERLDPDPVCPERLDPDPVNIIPDPKPWPLQLVHKITINITGCLIWAVLLWDLCWQTLHRSHIFKIHSVPTSLPDQMSVFKNFSSKMFSVVSDLRINVFCSFWSSDEITELSRSLFTSWIRQQHLSLLFFNKGSCDCCIWASSNLQKVCCPVAIP